MYVSLWVCLCVYLFIPTYDCVYMSICLCVCVFVCFCFCLYLCIHTQVWSACVCVCVWVSKCGFTHTELPHQSVGHGLLSMVQIHVMLVVADAGVHTHAGEYGEEEAPGVSCLGKATQTTLFTTKHSPHMHTDSDNSPSQNTTHNRIDTSNTVKAFQS